MLLMEDVSDYDEYIAVDALPSNLKQARFRHVFATVGNTLAHDTNNTGPQLLFDDIGRTSHSEDQLTAMYQVSMFRQSTY